MNWENQIQQLFRQVKDSDHRKLEVALKRKQNPLSFEEIEMLAADENDPQFLGGGGDVPGVGQSVVLGGAVCGTIVNFSVSGPATVVFEMWFTAGQIPAGAWTVGGPGSSGNVQLNCNVIRQVPPGCPEWFGQIVTIRAKGVNGTFPVRATYNP